MAVASVTIGLILFLVAVLRGHVDFRTTNAELEEYVAGVMDADLDRLTPHLCERVQAEIAALPGGLEQARSESLDALPAPVQEIAGLRGGSQFGTVRLALTNGETIRRYLFILWVDDRPQFCPLNATELWGQVHRPT